MPTILEGIKEGFKEEFSAAVPDDAIRLMNDGYSNLQGNARRDQMVNQFMNNFGTFLVNAAYAGLTQERCALLIAQEYQQLAPIKVRGAGSEPQFSTFIKYALRTLFTQMVREVIRERVELWDTRATADE